MCAAVQQFFHALVVTLLDWWETKFRPWSFAYAINPLIDRCIRYSSPIDLTPKIVYLDDRWAHWLWGNKYPLQRTILCQQTMMKRNVSRRKQRYDETMFYIKNQHCDQQKEKETLFDLFCYIKLSSAVKIPGRTSFIWFSREKSYLVFHIGTSRSLAK